MERPAGERPLAAGKVEEGDPAKFLVSVISYRKRLLDEDNLSEKYMVDCLRYAGLIPCDSPDRVSIKASQVKVGKDEPEKTLIRIVQI